METDPSHGDVLVRGDTGGGFVLMEAVSLKRIAGPVRTLEAALEAARTYGASDVWQQGIDNRGRPLGDPFLLPRRPAAAVRLP